MESVKKWLAERHKEKNGVLLHYSAPKLLGTVSSIELRHWARTGAENKLERAVIAGQGRRLLAEAEALPLSRYICGLIRKCDALHAAVEKGSLLEIQELLEREYNRHKYVMCWDEAGAGLLHKAIFYNYLDIAEYLVESYPQLVHLKDSEGRTALHYTAACRDEAAAAELLQRAGAARGARDAAGRTLAHYRAARTLLALPAQPTVADMPQPKTLVVKRHNIRIWCHECDMARLQRVVWEGQGPRLLSEVSSQPVVKRFLEAVPYIMNTIRDIHSSVINNDLEGVIKLSCDPVPPQILSSRDVNNMTVMHKAAGLGHNGILKYIIERYPQGINDIDNDGRTPLHYAAGVRDDQHTYKILVSSGADESVVDNKNKTPGYYINRATEIDKNIFKHLPEAPRTPSSAYPSTWDWKILSSDFIADLNKRSRKKHLKASSENISIKNNTNTISNTLSENNNTSEMRSSNTCDLINNLPDLNEPNISAESNITNGNNNHEHAETKQDYEENDKTIQKVENHRSTEDLKQNNEDIEKHEDHPIENVTQELTEENHDKTENQNSNQNFDEEGNVHLNSNTDEIDVEHNEPIIDLKHDINQDQHENTEKKLNLTNLFDGNQNEGDDQKDEKKIENHKDEETNIIHKSNIEPASNPDDKEIDLSENNNHNNDAIKILNSNDNESRNELIKNGNADEEGQETKSSIDEGNNINDRNEDDDDVQVQVNSHPDNISMRPASATLSKNDGSTERGNLTNSRNHDENLIEGIISNDAEQETLDASILQGSVTEDILIVDNEIDPEVTDLINKANMEMLATLVLNGEGSRLIGRHSGNQELQAFLDNVPAYMQKINKVHIAAKEGSLKDLQAALDRRKFAIARDPITPNGATPLHVATVFGKTSILKYLGGRFPETLSAVDFEGRTALHYAAVLPDNGHYYNLLQQLGANSKDLDDNGKSAEDFYKNPTLLLMNQLQADFGISEEISKNMFSDKVPDDHVSSRRDLDMPEASDTIERCYSLLASARPTRTPLSASSNKATPSNVLKRFLKRPIFDLIKFRVTKLDHNLFDIIWPAVKKLPDNRNIVQTVEEDFPGGISAPDYYVYDVYTEFLNPLIKDLHNLNVHSELHKHPISNFVDKSLLKKMSDPTVEINVDPSDEFVLAGSIECSRNVKGFEMPLNLKIGKLETIERILTTILLQEKFTKILELFNPESDQQIGTYYTLNEVLEKRSEICATLASSGLLIALCDREEIDDCTRLHGKHWPYGRGVYVSDDKSVAVWINVHDHLRVLISTPLDNPGEIGVPFTKMTYIMSFLSENLDFVWHYSLGHLSSRPTFLGAGIRFSLIVDFPSLSRDTDNIKSLCAMRGLQYRETLNTNIARISNYQCLSINESNCFNDFVTASSNLLHLEKDLSMQNSAHIATLLTNIFKKKRSSLTNIDGDTEDRSLQQN